MKALEDKYKGVNIALQKLKNENNILRANNDKLAEALKEVEIWIDGFECYCIHDFVCPRCSTSNKVHLVLKEVS